MAFAKKYVFSPIFKQFKAFEKSGNNFFEFLDSKSIGIDVKLNYENFGA